MPERPTAADRDSSGTPAAVRVLCRSAEETRALARRLGQRLHGGDVVVLTGDLGAGKTTFVQGLALGLGVTQPVTSPTFVLARHQRADPSGPRPGGPDLVHVDAYRLDGALELDDLDLDSDLDRSVVVVEWGRGLAERLSPRRVEVRIEREAVAPHPGPDGGGGAADDEERTLHLALVGEHRDLDPAVLATLPGALPGDRTRSTTEQETPC